MIIFIFGDSITQGFWDNKGGWADRIKAYLLDKDIQSDFENYTGVHNLGIDGNTTAQVLERFDGEVDARKWPKSNYGVLVAIGTNDTLHRNENDYESTPEVYDRQLNELLEKAQKITSKIAFINLLPVDERFTNPLASSSTGKCYTNSRIDMFNNVLTEFCEKNKIELIDVSTVFMKNNYKELLADGTHPNSNGHKLIFETVLPTIESWT